ncbi:hypothetical protein G7Z17_g1610 [Cylindrodendrum hubeiense]|uniref:Acyltransferase 3 domain-containing protein n=1 Tax=Cylindrodendrum hubeiense TaxID=595255 RepID=A0A9P5LL67_9HYPO|nr:hypothetical protein G7Z17_g1610 [Cylindrodendrum hubeiense]
METSIIQQYLHHNGKKLRFLDEPLEDTSILEKQPLTPNGTNPILGRQVVSSDVPTWVRYMILSPIAFIYSLLSRPFLTRLGWFLVPSYLQGRHARQTSPKLSPTAYLDGMRGLAALCVLFCHYSYTAFDVGFSWGANYAHYDILKLPILRLVYQGPVSVTIFFLISGYSLSYKPLKLMRAQNGQELLNNLSSSVFRRLMRLYIPTALATAIIWEDYGWTTLRMIHVFGWDRPFAYNFYHEHLWTIPIEYRCSLYLFLVLLGTARLRMIWRYAVLFVTILLSYRHSKWEMIMFLFGMGLAEWDLYRGAHTIGPADAAKRNSLKQLQSRFWNCVSIFGLYLMSFPDAGGDSTPGYIYISSWIPFWWNSEIYRPPQSVGCFLFALAVSNSDFWKAFYNSAFIQYLGKISYALYLVHGPTMHMVGYHWQKWAWSITGVEGEQYAWGFALSMCFCIPTVFWVADVFWRAIDVPTVKFARWFENQLVVKS